MLYLIIGSPKEKIDKEVAKIAAKTSVEKMDAFSFNADALIGKVGGFSLFGGIEKITMVLNSIYESADHFETLKGLLKGLSEASDNFIVVESELGKEEIKFFEKVGAKLIELKDSTSPKKSWGSGDENGFNPFAIADAVGKRSPKEAWIEYVRARENNNEPEEIHGRVIGKVRDILLAQQGTPEEVGMHPFVHRKAKTDMKNWDEGDLKRLYSKLVSLYHESRLGGEELDVALEKELLRI